MREDMFFLSKIRTYKNMPDLVAESLKEAIMRGGYKGGTQLKQDEIAKYFDVSLIPVREALIQLEGMHLVKCIRNKGALVTKLSVKEMKQLFELRKVLEVGSVMLIKEKVPSDTLNKMHLIIDKMKHCQDSYHFSRYNKLFYALLCDCGNNKELSDSYEHLFVRVERYLNYVFHYIPDYIKDYAHYEMIVNLLEQGDFTTLQQVLKNRIEEIEEVFVHYLEKKYSKIEDLDWNVLLPLE